MSDHALALTVKHHGDLESESFVMALDTNQGGGGRQHGSGWAPRVAAPLMAPGGGALRNDFEGGTWVIQ